MSLPRENMRTTGWTARLGPAGVWATHSIVDEELAREIERLGYGTLWLGGSPSADLEQAERLLDSTRELVVATGIVNIWNSDAAELADSYHRIVARHPGRILLGIGSGHREATPHRARPVHAMSRYLDVLDEHAVPVHDRVVSALGPRMLALAGERSAGTHPYLTVPSQTREQRDVLGPDALIAPEQTVVLDPDPVTARASARRFLARYLRLVNYADTMRRGGFTEADIEGEGSDELVDAIVAHGTAQQIVVAAREHRAAGADHVCVQVQPLSDTTRALAEIARAAELHGR